MHPVAFEIGSLSIRWYGIMAACGFIAANFVIAANRKKAAMSPDQASSLVMLAMISGIIGARLFYVVQFFSQFRYDLWKILRIDQGGLVFYGGFFLAFAAVAVFCKINKLDFIRVLDVTSPALAIGHAFGRAGCFLNGCCFGKVAGGCFGIAYPAGTLPAMKYGTVPLHPVQLYEAGFNVLFFVLLLWILRRGRRGMTIGVYLACYGVMRFADEFFRGDHEHFISGLTPAQVIGLILIPAGIIMAVYFAKHDRKTSEVSN